MRERKHINFSVWSVFVLLALLLSTAGMRSIFAQADGRQPGSPQDGFLSVVSPPTPVEPTGTYWTNDLTYKWTVVSGATDYQYRVWDGATKMWDQTVSSSACDASYCTDHPTALQLIDGTYKWTVRAKKDGIWTIWSDLKWYSIKAGFNSQFRADAAGWQPTYGGWTWDIHDGNYRTSGVLGKFTTSRYNQVYGIYTYEVRMRRKGSETDGQCGIYFNGNPWPQNSWKMWNKGYMFLVDRNGHYSLWRLDNGVTTMILSTTDTNLIHSGWYNTLKVTYHKSTGYTQIFINGTRVYEGTLTTYKWGNVGLTMYKYSLNWEQTLVDWATLSVVAPKNDKESGATGGIYFDEASAVLGGGEDIGH